MYELSGQSALSRIDGDPQAEIMAVICDETQAFIDDDYAAWARCWLQSEQATMIAVTSTTGVDATYGWSAISTEMQTVMNNGYGCDMVTYENSDWRIHIAEDVAWVTYRQFATNRSGESWRSFETRFLQRQSDGWKIAYCAFVGQERAITGQRVLSVDPKGQMLWASKDALAAIASHPILTLSAGRLRARRLDWDKALQAAISRAGKFHNFYQLRHFEDETGGPFRYPAVLGETDEGGVAVVMVSVRDGVTYIDFDVTQTIYCKLTVAQAVFGLSDAQTKVAQHIAEGLGPKGAAEKLDISINTARTHLTRLYEKTGVNSQAALVRILLSVG
ncbi:LuxR C-terminal-related transcriptional regulator [Cognatishimia maritima]|nr:LuxR C-terminal-related transcriptional regulator [Cognatishimia maritima]